MEGQALHPDLGAHGTGWIVRKAVIPAEAGIAFRKRGARGAGTPASAGAAL